MARQKGNARRHSWRPYLAGYQAYNRVLSETFPSNPPASSSVIVASLVRPEYLVEFGAVVHLSNQR